MQTHRFFHNVPTRRWLGSERQSALPKEIVDLKHNGKTHIDTPGVIGAFEAYYTELFISRSSNDRGIGYSSLLEALCQLAKDDRSIVDGVITVEEISIAIETLKNNKTPGPDGLSGSFITNCRTSLLLFY